MSSAARFLAIAAAATLAAAGCGAGLSSAAPVDRIVATTSFGMCVGYCSTRLELSEAGAVLIREGGGGRGTDAPPPQRLETALSAGEWSALKRAAAETRLDALPDVVGCPDCADGGAESLAIEGGGKSKAVSFDHGKDLAEAEPLLSRVRALRDQLLQSGE